MQRICVALFRCFFSLLLLDLRTQVPCSVYKKRQVVCELHSHLLLLYVWENYDLRILNQSAIAEYGCAEAIIDRLF